MRSNDGCGRVLGLVVGFGLLLAFCLPTAAFAIATSDPVAFAIACVIAACGLYLIERAVRG